MQVEATSTAGSVHARQKLRRDVDRSVQPIHLIVVALCILTCVVRSALLGLFVRKVHPRRLSIDLLPAPTSAGNLLEALPNA